MCISPPPLHAYSIYENFILQVRFPPFKNLRVLVFYIANVTCLKKQNSKFLGFQFVPLQSKPHLAHLSPTVSIIASYTWLAQAAVTDTRDWRLSNRYSHSSGGWDVQGQGASRSDSWRRPISLL